MEEVPIAYQVMLDKLYKNSFRGRIDKAKARWILTYIFRMGNRVTSLLTEMEEMELIEFEPGGRYIQVLVKPKIIA